MPYQKWKHGACQVLRGRSLPRVPQESAFTPQRSGKQSLSRLNDTDWSLAPSASRQAAAPALRRQTPRTLQRNLRSARALPNQDFLSDRCHKPYEEYGQRPMPNSYLNQVEVDSLIRFLDDESHRLTELNPTSGG